MSFNNSFTAVTGATYTAAQYNTHTRDNLTAIWVYTTAGDIAYATGAAALARLAAPAGLSLLQHNGSAPSYLAKGAVGSSLRMDTAGNNFEWSGPQQTVVYGSGNAVISAGQAIPWSSEIVDDGNWHNAGGDAITVSVSWRYRPSAIVGLWTPTGGATVVYSASLRVNGTTIYLASQPFYEDGSMQTLTFPSVPLLLSAGQSVSLHYDSGGTVNRNYSYLGLERVW